MRTELSELATTWAADLSRGFAHRLAEALGNGVEAVEDLASEATLPLSTEAVQRASQLSLPDALYLSGALTALLNVAQEAPKITPVWTGPDSGSPGDRLTLGVLADLIERARREILLVSYATFPSAEVRGALERAAGRGVQVILLLERSVDNPHFGGNDDPFPGLTARRLCWPSDERPPGASMHAKVLVIDRSMALIGSANLTDYGLERNLECGLLVEGGPVPGAVAEHLLALRHLSSQA